MTLVELGKRTGYSAAQVSRYERGVASLTDIAVLRRFAAALAITPEAFGLAAAEGSGEEQHPPRMTGNPSRADLPGARLGGAKGEQTIWHRPRSTNTAAAGQPGIDLAADPGSDESVKPYADRGLVTRQQWNGIIRGVSRELWLYGMAEFGYATDDGVPGIFASATSRGCRVRILLLNPESPATTAIDSDEGHPPGTLSARIRAALGRFGLMGQKCGSRMQIRVYDGYPTVSVVRGDDAMLVTPYLRFFIGSNSPTFEFRADQAPKMFTRSARHFENTWNLAEDWT